MMEAIHVLEQAGLLAKVQAGELRRAPADSAAEREVNECRAVACEHRNAEMTAAVKVLRGAVQKDKQP